MKIEKAFLKSKVAQRIALLFVACALLPIIILAVLSIIQVKSQLQEQSEARLAQTSKSYGMAVYERLLFLEADLIRVALKIPTALQDSPPLAASIINEYQKDRFKSLAVVSGTKILLPILGSIDEVPVFSFEEKRQIQAGSPVLRSRKRAGQPPKIFMCIGADPDPSGQNILIGEVDPFYLWYMSYEDSIPAMTTFFVLDHEKNLLFSTKKSDPELPVRFSAEVESSVSGNFDWEHKGEKYLACFRNIFLQTKFKLPSWIVVTAEAKKDIRSPITNFQKTYILVILLSLWIVIFLSFNQIRRSLIPLERLKDGVNRIAQKDFDARVIITSRDEFADVAKSFNTMAYRLGKQFRTLTAIAEIDRGILSSFETEDIVNSLLTRMPEVFPCDSVGFALLNANKPEPAKTFTWHKETIAKDDLEGFSLLPSDAKNLLENRHYLYFEHAGSVPNYLAPLVQNGAHFSYVFPLFLSGTLEGIISLGYHSRPNFSEEELSLARQICNQIGIGLTNARLIEELSDFNLGTLRALARAIDAKSPWTAGHSERVTDYGLEIGKEMGYSDEEMDILQRGGLLHDIGKIGIPNEILDKTGDLTEKERIIIEDHPRLGVRILEPIGAFTDVLRIVQQHHENFDGTGYPNKLAGEEISEYSRIFAVADRYEALTTDRPYRKAIEPLEAVKFLKENSGKQFDPKVVAVFLKVLKKKYGIQIPPSDDGYAEISAWSPK
jgi:putative nucleotidyltransferase with HDIG domain